MEQKFYFSFVDFIPILSLPVYATPSSGVFFVESSVDFDFLCSLLSARLGILVAAGQVLASRFILT
jgi:hypothetical protein